MDGPRVLRALVLAAVPVVLLGGAVSGARARQAAPPPPPELRLPLPRAEGETSFADPSVLPDDGEYHAFSTNEIFGTPRNIQVMTSTDLYRWSDLRDAMPFGPTWAWPLSEGGEFWAPTAAAFGPRSILYFAAHHRFAPVDDPGWCIGYAVADDPGGPYTPGTKPLICSLDGTGATAAISLFPTVGAGVIDPQVYVAPDGDRFLHFKAIDNPAQIYGVALAGTGLTVSGEAHPLLADPAGGPSWEDKVGFGGVAPLIENPAMDRNPDAVGTGFPFYLYYSGSDWRTFSYSTGVAACQTPLGPCERTTVAAPWLATTGSAGGPGGLSVFQSASGERWAVYHAWGRGERASAGRRLHVEPLGYDGLEPQLVGRVPTGAMVVLTGPGRVLVAGEADDPDTGRPSTVVVTEDGVALDTPVPARRGEWALTWPAEAGQHSYCAEIVDRTGEPGRRLGCQAVTVPPLPPETWGDVLSWPPPPPLRWSQVLEPPGGTPTTLPAA
jgi:hypothetical protein